MVQTGVALAIHSYCVQTTPTMAEGQDSLYKLPSQQLPGDMGKLSPRGDTGPLYTRTHQVQSPKTRLTPAPATTDKKTD